MGPACLLSEERKRGRTRARGKTKELMVNNRAAIPERASLRLSAKYSPEGGDGLSGGRSSAESTSLDQTTPLPEGRCTFRSVQPRLDLLGGRATGHQEAVHPGSPRIAAPRAASGGFKASRGRLQAAHGRTDSPVGLDWVGCAAEAAEPAPPDGTHNQEASGIFS